MAETVSQCNEANRGRPAPGPERRSASAVSPPRSGPALRSVRRLLPIVLLLLLVVSAPSLWSGVSVVQAAEEIVPAGRWLLRTSFELEDQSTAITHANVSGSMLDYLVPDAPVRDHLKGSVSRSVQQTVLELGIGLLDTWNLVLTLPHVSVSQQAQVTSDGSAAADLQAGRLVSRTESGLGELRLMSLHRPVFSDRNGFVWGYGVQIPGSDPVSDYAGVSTLQVAEQTQRTVGVIHYTRYPALPYSRFDLRIEASMAYTRVLTPLDQTTVTSVSVRPGNGLSFQLSWQQRLAGVLTQASFERRSVSRTFLNGSAQDDLRSALLLGLGTVWGNLEGLEQGPLSFPYEIGVRLETTVEGFNVPESQRLQVSLQTYF